MKQIVPPNGVTLHLKFLNLIFCMQHPDCAYNFPYALSQGFS